MDLLTHIFLPLAAIYGTRANSIADRHLLILSPLAILPDADVFLGIQRGLFHSLLFILPLIFLFFLLARKYLKYSALLLGSHLALDFITGLVPFLYPLVNTSVGIEFPFVIKFGSTMSIVEYLPRLVFGYPGEVHGQSYDVFSSFGIATVLLFMIIYRKRSAANAE